MLVSDFPILRQKAPHDCGPTCLRMIAKYYGIPFSGKCPSYSSQTSKSGITLLDLSELAESIGFETMGVRLTFKELSSIAHLPCIAHLKGDHFVVIVEIGKNMVHVIDPGCGAISYLHEKFIMNWIGSNYESVKKGICLLLVPKY